MPLNNNSILKRTYAEWFVALVLATFTAAGLWWYLNSLRSDHSLQAVITVQKDLPVRHTLAQSDVATTLVPARLIPLSAIRTSTLLVGHVLTHSLNKGEIVVKNDFVADRDPDSEAVLIPEGQLGIVLPSNWLSAPLPRVKKNDLVTIYIATASSANMLQNNGVLIKSVPILTVKSTKDGALENIFVALSPTQVAAILQARASQFHLLVAAESGNTLSAPPPTTSLPLPSSTTTRR